MKNSNYVFGACFAAALIAAGILIYRHFSVFPLTVMLGEDETIYTGSQVTLDDQVVGRVADIEPNGGKQRAARILIEKRDAFPRLKAGLVRITGGDSVALTTGLCGGGAPVLERGAFVESVSPTVYFARRYLDPVRWPAWLWAFGAAAIIGWFFRRPLCRLTA